MKNITSESKRLKRDEERELPSLSEYGAAKLREGFGILGNKFNAGRTRAKTKMELLSVEAELRKLATHIGHDIIKQFEHGENAPIVKEEFLDMADDLLAKRDFFQQQLDDDD